MTRKPPPPHDGCAKPTPGPELNQARRIHLTAALWDAGWLIPCDEPEGGQWWFRGLADLECDPRIRIYTDAHGCRWWAQRDLNPETAQ